MTPAGGGDELLARMNRGLSEYLSICVDNTTKGADDSCGLHRVALETDIFEVAWELADCMVDAGLEADEAVDCSVEIARAVIDLARALTETARKGGS